MTWFVLANFFFSSLLTYYFYSCIAAVIIKALRIRKPSHVLLVQLFPLIKLACVFIFWDLTNWSIVDGNLPCFDDSRSKYLTIFAELSRFDWIMLYKIGVLTGFHDGKTFTLIDLIASNISISVLQILVVLTAVYYLFSLCRNIAAVLFERRALKKIHVIKTPEVFKDTLVYLSNNYRGSPFIQGIFRPKIVFPETLWMALDDKQKQAIISHELGHKRYFDNAVKFFCLVIATVFSHIPMRKQIEQIFFRMEIRADEYALKKGVKKNDLAHSIYQICEKTTFKAASAFSGLEGIKNRLRAIDEKRNLPMGHMERLGVMLSFVLICTLFVSKIFVV